MTQLETQKNQFNILDFQHYYLVGIKGVAMTGLAQILLDAGKTVRGSDTPESFVTQQTLEKLGCAIDTDFSSPLPKETECVVYTGAHNGSLNPQVQAAHSQHIPAFTHAQALGSLSTQKRTIAVCGVGGKSTVSAMITWILEKTGHKPSYAIGVGEIRGLARNASWRDDSELFVIEADEYTEDPSSSHSTGTLVPRFHYIQPEIVVCTNISFDHPDVYTSPEQTQRVFESFFKQIKPTGTLITHQAVSATIPTHVNQVTYGTTGTFRYTINHQPDQIKPQVTISYDQDATPLHLNVPGEHNIENATAAIAATNLLDVTLSQAADALGSFNSTSRRFEFLGTYQGAKLYDDYAHHPREIAAVIQTLKDFFPNQPSIVAFQPHTFSRTEALFDDFVTVLSAADHCIILDIFGSAREQQTTATVSSATLSAAIQAANPDATVAQLSGVTQLASYCQQHLKEGDIFITLGAGDIYTVHDLLLSI
ncbi:MAG: UDP-N-acetylmuramate--L-alanine ligase [Patescibacteria group bacterium]